MRKERGGSERGERETKGRERLRDMKDYNTIF